MTVCGPVVGTAMVKWLSFMRRFVVLRRVVLVAGKRSVGPSKTVVACHVAVPHSCELGTSVVVRPRCVDRPPSKPTCPVDIVFEFEPERFGEFVLNVS